MNGTKRLMNIVQLITQLKSIEKSISGNLVQCGFGMDSKINFSDTGQPETKELIIKQAVDSRSHKVTSAVVGGMLNFEITIKAGMGATADEESQITYSGLQLAENISEFLRDMFYTMLEDKAEEDQHLIEKIAAIEPEAAPLYEKYLKEQQAVREMQEKMEQTQIIPINVSEEPHLIEQIFGISAEVFKERVMTATATIAAEREMEEAVKRAGGIATTLKNGPKSIN